VSFLGGESVLASQASVSLPPPQADSQSAIITGEEVLAMLKDGRRAARGTLAPPREQGARLNTDSAGRANLEKNFLGAIHFL
jgi:hypothetical protein